MRPGRHPTETTESRDGKRTFENNDIVLSSQLESFTLSFDCGGGSRRVTAVLKGIHMRPQRIKDTGHTGTEYRTFGFGLSVGQFSRISRRENDFMPSPSVPTSEDARGSNSVQMAKGRNSTDHMTAAGFEHRNHSTENCVSWGCQ